MNYILDNATVGMSNDASAPFFTLVVQYLHCLYIQNILAFTYVFASYAYLTRQGHNSKKKKKKKTTKKKNLK